MNVARKLLVLGVNRLLERGLISLDPKVPVVDGHIREELAGAPSVIIWRGISGEELEVSVWWNYDHSRHPQAELLGSQRETFHGPTPLAKPQRYKEFVGAFASGWLERRTGAFLQGRDTTGISERYVRKADAARLEGLPAPVPNGFAAEGKFFA